MPVTRKPASGPVESKENCVWCGGFKQVRFWKDLELCNLIYFAQAVKVAPFTPLEALCAVPFIPFFPYRSLGYSVQFFNEDS